MRVKTQQSAHTAQNKTENEVSDEHAEVLLLVKQTKKRKPFLKEAEQELHPQKSSVQQLQGFGFLGWTKRCILQREVKTNYSILIRFFVFCPLLGLLNDELSILNLPRGCTCSRTLRLVQTIRVSLDLTGFTRCFCTCATFWR